jgi:hypothetical protein
VWYETDEQRRDGELADDDEAALTVAACLTARGDMPGRWMGRPLGAVHGDPRHPAPFYQNAVLGHGERTSDSGARRAAPEHGVT